MPTWRSSRTTSPDGGAVLLVDLGRAAEAVDLASVLLEDNPDHTFVRQMKIRALADLDRHVEALGEVDLLAADEHDSWARATRGGLLADVGRIDEAVELLEPLVRDELANAFAAGALGYCYRKLERWPEAVAPCRPRSISMPVSPGTSRSSDGRSTAPAAPPTPRRCTGGS